MGVFCVCLCVMCTYVLCVRMCVCVSIVIVSVRMCCVRVSCMHVLCVPFVRMSPLLNIDIATINSIISSFAAFRVQPTPL